MTYPGNAALDPDVKGRVLDTFRHSLDKAARGNLEEARLGCEFISRLDPEFTPARELSRRLRAGDGPVEVADLREHLEAPAAGSVESSDLELPDESELSFDFSDEDLEDLGDLDAGDLPDFESDSQAPEFAAGGAKEPADTAALRAEFERLLEERRHIELIERAEVHETEVASDPELERLRGTAVERREAEPYVMDFVEKARQAQARGEEDEVERLLGKAEALDPTHPEIDAVRRGEFPGASEDDDVSGLGFAMAGEDELTTGEDVEMAELELGEEALELDDEALDLEAAPTRMGVVDSTAATSVAAVSEGEDDERIAALLEEGQEAFEHGEYQAAIDAWSRIFLIDIDHQKAARLIDEARTRKAEEEREVEEVFHEALAHAEAGETEQAERGFRRVLELQPGHLAAEEYLERIEQGEDLAAPVSAEGADVSLDDALLSSVEAGAEEEAALKEEILVPPEPGEERPPPPAELAAVRRPTSGAKKETRPTFWIVAAVALLVVGGVAWFVLDRWEVLFPNTEDTSPVSQRQTEATSPIERARALFEAGERESAVTQLERVPPLHPRYDEAQALLAEWRVEETAGGEAESAAETMRQAERRAELVMRARAAMEAERSLAAVRYYEQAAEISPLQPEDAERLAAARDDLGHLQEELQLVRDGEFDRVLRDLWLLREEYPDDPDVRELLATAYYNLGVRNLQQSNFADARENLAESKRLGLDDSQTERLMAMAETYRDRSEDLLYRIFVKYLEPRAI